MAGAVPAAAGPVVYSPVLLGNLGEGCGPCLPAPLLTRATPDSLVVALRYRWSARSRTFEAVSKQEVGFTDRQGELRFGLDHGPGSVDKVVVHVAGGVSEGFIFFTTAECPLPRMCGPRRYHAMANASRYLPGGLIFATVTGAGPGSRLDFSQEEYLEDFRGARWDPIGTPVAAEVDANGHATVMLDAAGTGVYRVIARDPATGEESGTSLFEVREPRF